MSAAPIAPGSRVTLHFRIRLEEGSEVDSSFGEEPLEFTLGDGTLLPALEQLLLGLETGARETFLVAPEEAFGLRDPSNIQSLPRDTFPADMTLEPGTVIGFSAPSGEEVPGMVLEAEGDQVRVDFNHPLAGHALTFEVQVLAVQEAS